MSESQLVTKKEVLKAREVLRSVVKETPLEKDLYLSEKYDCTVYLKREDLQWVRSFKLRGAYYAISQLNEIQLVNGVVCASAGNHAQGVAFTCAKLNIPATIFMPTTTPQQKQNQVKFFGKDKVTIILTGDTFDECSKEAIAYSEKMNCAFIHPFEDRHTIAGQGTIAVEVFDELAKEDVKLDYLFAAIGGGGLISGLLSYTDEVSPTTKIVGVEPSGAASMAKSLEAGEVVSLDNIDKFVDGASVGRVGGLNYQHCVELVHDVIDVEEGLVCSTILDMYTKQAIVAEPAGALSVAALEPYREEIKGKTVVCIISGGNNDINRMQEIEERSLLFEGLKLYFLVNFPQRPGALKEFVSDVLGPNDDITKFEYTKKVNRGSGPVVIGVLLKYKEDSAGLIERLTVFDPTYISINDNQMLYTLLV
ncbi:threonine ammonia-lyase IlvA [Carnobacterium gallinarum]|uniref:threonine ammonia-lyase IlvA n=1 Tax=Carnobacterium gallinarum TaxID=2749 RepID=UPI00055111A7|nr:threonine ammonia-lyase IlvA [Carnobacterium gallinarum]